MSEHEMRCLLMVMAVRMDTLRWAIERREWDEVEFQFDRVNRALTKAQCAVKEATNA